MKTIVVYLFLCLSVSLTAQNGASILDKAATAYAESNGVKTEFSMQIRSKQYQATESFEGEIHIKGDKFTLKTPDVLTWFDGKTQWTYMVRTDEVNVTNPEKEELQFMNPSLLLKDYKKGFNVEFKGESTSPNGKSAYDVVLVPKKKGNVTSIELQIEKLTSFPASIIVSSKDGSVNTIRITKIQTKLNQPDSFFVFKESDFPDAELIDLR